ncbi:RNA polymerase II transcription factor complex subunit [Sarcoptes scabiei]|nr:RNA polymerase II transcription factor complex subunit [Sarcoptes scabiei]
MSIIDKESDEFSVKGSRETVDYSGKVTLPKWADLEKIRLAQKLHNRYRFSLSIAHLDGLLCLVFIETIHRTLLNTGKSDSYVALFRRYFDTLMHVKKWYENDFWIENNPGYQSLQEVKEMHRRVSDSQNENLKDGDVRSISLKDMALTQFAFIGFIILCPEQLGFSTKKKDLEAVAHFWAVCGSMLGIPDEYNLCLGEYDRVNRRCRKILDEDFRPRMEEFSNKSSEMSEKIYFVFNRVIALFSYKATMKYLFDTLQLQCPFQMNLFDSSVLAVMKIIMKLFYRFTIVRLCFNYLSIIMVQVAKMKFVQNRIIRNLRLLDLKSQ